MRPGAHRKRANVLCTLAPMRRHKNNGAERLAACSAPSRALAF